MFKPMLTATTGWTGYESCIGKRQTKVIKIDKMGRLKRKLVFFANVLQFMSFGKLYGMLHKTPL